MHKLKKKKQTLTKNKVMQSYYLKEMQLCFEPIEAWLNFLGIAGDDAVKPKLTPEICLSWVRNLAGENQESHQKKGNPLRGAWPCVVCKWLQHLGWFPAVPVSLALPSWFPFDKGLILPARAFITNSDWFRWDLPLGKRRADPGGRGRGERGQETLVSLLLLPLVTRGGRSWVICFYFLFPICLGPK